MLTKMPMDVDFSLYYPDRFAHPKHKEKDNQYSKISMLDRNACRCVHHRYTLDLNDDAAARGERKSTRHRFDVIVFFSSFSFNDNYRQGKSPLLFRRGLQRASIRILSLASARARSFPFARVPCLGTLILFGCDSLVTSSTDNRRHMQAHQ